MLPCGGVQDLMKFFCLMKCCKKHMDQEFTDCNFRANEPKWTMKYRGLNEAPPPPATTTTPTTTPTPTRPLGTLKNEVFSPSYQKNTHTLGEVICFLWVRRSILGTTWWTAWSPCGFILCCVERHLGISQVNKRRFQKGTFPMCVRGMDRHQAK